MSISTTEFVQLRDIIADLCGIRLADDKRYLAEQRLEALLPLTPGCKWSDLSLHLRQGTLPGLKEKVIDLISTNETFFFRDEHPFETFRKVLLPKYVAELQAARSRYGSSAKILLWSAASSSGQEAYSLAMLIREYLEEVRPAGLSLQDFNIIGSDISDAILAKAKAGLYSDLEMRRGLTEARRQKHFQREGSGWRIQAPLRAMVQFRKMNLIKDPFPENCYSVVFCRNVLIYFDLAAKKSILAKLHRSMTASASLVLGASEGTFTISDSFATVNAANIVFHQKLAK
ncbi:MAG: protein-glutamate O-methyltransferase CheR [Planctomycetes bacterium]|nr:protein-glutamate O-methyltransferase CheR [Planctomycetota bacterium]